MILPPKLLVYSLTRRFKQPPIRALVIHKPMDIQRPWLDSYPPATPATIEVPFASISELAESAMQRYAAKPAFTNLDVTLSYSDIDQYSRAFAAFLQQELQLQPAERIAIMMPNLLQYPVALFGALRVGLTVVNTNPLYTARELQHQLKDSGATAIVVSETCAAVLEKCLQQTTIKHIIVCRIGDMLPQPRAFLINAAVKYIKKKVPPYALDNALAFAEVLRKGRELTLQPVVTKPDDTALLQYTSGTTGKAKGAMLSHGNICANVEQVRSWVQAQIVEGKEVVITALPLYHIFALTGNCLAFFNVGGHNHLITDPRDLKTFVSTLQKVPFTVITGVNTLFNALINARNIDDVDFSHLKISLGGGMAVQKRVADDWRKLTGCNLTEAYGLSETSPAACINPLTLEEYNGCIGLPIASTDAGILSVENEWLPAGQAGELCIRGPQVMQGYWQLPEKTADVMFGEWFRTGDVAEMTADGYFKIVDRKKDMILVSGFNVYPTEVEQVLSAHPDVLECAVVGIPNEASGEVVKAFVVKKNSTLDEATLRAYSAENLTGYKRPKAYKFTDELPKNAVGKILRRELRDNPEQ